MNHFELPDQISVTTQEEELFEFLRSVVKANASNTVMRIAGGWVRDKLMGLEADDIDISLDNITGNDFGLMIKEHLQGNKAKANTPTKSPTKVSVIGIRPELGKFVETATVHCKGFSLDLLSLRSQVQVGDKLRKSTESDDNLLAQAAEDAHLRDFTMNALFYNINTGKLEDFVGGKEDIKEKTIRCPNAFDRRYFIEKLSSDSSKEMEGTLLRLREDPNRSLRAIRFACKFGFTLSDSIKQVITSKEVQEFLLHKTTNERIFTEIQKTFLLPPDNALQGLKYYVDFNLLYSVFPMACEISDSFWKQNGEICYRCCERVFRHNEELHVAQNVLILAAFFTPTFGSYTYPNGVCHDFPFTKEHVKETWKYPSKQSNDVLDIMQAAVEIRKRKEDPWNEELQVFTGRLLRKTRDKWIHALDIAITWDITLFPEEEEHIKLSYAKFGDKIEMEGLDGKFGKTAWEMAPLFSGRDLSSKFGVKPGKHMGVLIDNLIDWQLLHMNGSVEDAAEFMKVAISNIET